MGNDKKKNTIKAFETIQDFKEVIHRTGRKRRKMKLFQMSQKLGIRIATGVLLGLFLLMFILRASTQGVRMTADDRPALGSMLYLQAKYSLGGVSSFSSVSQFFLGLIFYAPIFVFAVALLLSTFLKTKFVGNSQVLGLDANLILLGISAVGLLSIFIMPANASRIYASVELAPFQEYYAEQFEAEVQDAPGIYLDLTFKFFGWYLYLLAYVFCLLLGLKIIELIDPQKETDSMALDQIAVIENAVSKDSETAVADIESAVQKDSDELLKTLDTAALDAFSFPKGDNEVSERQRSSDESEEKIPSLAEQFEANEVQTEPETEKKLRRKKIRFAEVKSEPETEENEIFEL